MSRLGSKIRSILPNSRGVPQSAFAFSRIVIITSLVVTGAIAIARQAGMLEGMELGVYDLMVRSRPSEGADDRLLVVGVSESDIQTRKEYPIADGTLAQLLEKIAQYQPRAIGLDILRDVPQGTGREALLAQLQQRENIIAACLLSSADDPGAAAPAGIPEERIGFANLPLDPGGTLRRSLLVSTPAPPKVPAASLHPCNNSDPENQVTSFDLQLAMLYLQARGIEPELTPNGEIKIGSTTLPRLDKTAGSYQTADASDYQIMLNYRSHRDAAQQVSLTEVLGDRVNPALVKDRIVLIGYTAPLVKDDFFTPYSAGARDSQTMPGVVVHAQNVSQILSAVLNNRPPIWYWPEWAEILWIGAWSLIGGILAWHARRLWLFGVGIAAALFVLSAICHFLFLQSGWIPLLPPAIALIATAIAVFFLKPARATRETSETETPRTPLNLPH